MFTSIFWLFVCSVLQRYLSHLNSSFKTSSLWAVLQPEKKCERALCDGEFYSQLGTKTITTYHIDITIRDQRMKNSGAFHLITRVIRQSNITVWKITLMSRRWRLGNRLSRRGATPWATDSLCASNKETLNIIALFFSTLSQLFSLSSFSSQTFALSR